jgi:isocitrate lyase
MSDKEIGEFCKELGRLGFVWQFITLAGFHMNALASEKFSKDFKHLQMIAYVEKIQREE